MAKSKKNNLANALLQNRTSEKPAIKSQPEGEAVQVLFRVDSAAKRQLEFLKIELGEKSLQAMLTDALNDYFQKHGKDRIA